MRYYFKKNMVMGRDLGGQKDGKTESDTNDITKPWHTLTLMRRTIKYKVTTRI